MDAFFVLSFLVGLAVVIDVFRRSPHEWEKADRKRGYWKFLAIILVVVGLGLFVGAAYAVLVLPRFRASGPASTDDFSSDDIRR